MIWFNNLTLNCMHTLGGFILSCAWLGQCEGTSVHNHPGIGQYTMYIPLHLHASGSFMLEF